MVARSLTIAVLFLGTFLWNWDDSNAQIVSITTPVGDYTVEESDEELEICLTASGTISQTFTITLGTSGVTALGGVDFNLVQQVFTFVSPNQPQCTLIPILEDDRLEASELFFVTFQSDNSLILVPSDMLVTIIDSNELELEFTEELYIAEESETANVCLTVANEDLFLDIVVTVTIDTSDGTATGGGVDYSSVILFKEFTSGSTNQVVCFGITIFDDAIEESTEYFLASFSTTHSSTIETIIFIADNDVSCDPLDDPINGEVEIIASTATFSCEDGYELAGEEDMLNCLTNGEWSDPIPTCQPVDCGELTILNGMVTYTPTSDTTFTSVATYRCDFKYKLVGFNSRTCQEDGDWSEEVPECVLIDCGLLPELENGHITYSMGTGLSSQALHTCDMGYEISGVIFRLCRFIGLGQESWTASPPTCNPVECGSLPDPPNGVVSLTGTTFTQTATYSCDDGYDLVGDNTVRTCQFDMTWSGEEPHCQIVDCGDLPQIENGELDLPDTVFGSVATYNCTTEGFLLEGESVLTCLDTGEWSDNEPMCRVADCGSLSPPVNGDITVGLTTFNSIAVYMCEVGYELVPSNTVRRCQADELWSGDDPICQIRDCGLLFDPPNGVVVINNGTTFGSVVSYSCDNGYNREGVSTRRCEADEDWSDEQPECIPVDCGTLDDPENGQISLSATTFESEAMYTCDPGYLVEGVMERYCQANTMWSDDAPTCEAVDCEPLLDPTNGMVATDRTTLGGTAMYTCVEGHFISGNEQRTCTTSGDWSGNMPVCQIVRCTNELLMNPVNGNVRTLDGIIFESEAMYDCNEGFAVIGQRVRVCGADGEWSGSAPVCQMIECPQLEDPENGNVELTPTSGGLLATYSCDEGYRLSSDVDALRICSSETGEWSGNVPTCIIEDCGPPSEIEENGEVLFGNTVFESIAFYSCDEGYVLNPADSDRRMCLANRTWEGMDPTCEPIDCGSLENPDNGTVSTVNTTLDSEAVYTCSSGFVLEGEMTRVCQSDGSWSDSPPVCQDIDECDVDNPCEVRCVNTPGSFECACNEGFQIVDRFNCEDINECLDNNGGCAQECTNTEGSFECDCNDGYDLASNGVECIDIDECETDVRENCHVNATCSNTDGSFLCSCPSGFEGDGITCEDVDECLTSSDTCEVNSQCVNTIGSFLCPCKDGYEEDEGSCSNINECVIGSHDCDVNANCTDRMGDFTCTCRDGFSGSGTSCESQCTTIIQLLLGTVTNCEQWRFDATRAKLSDISQEVSSELRERCACSFPDSHILNGEFNCNSQYPNQVLYRATLRGLSNSDCSSLVTQLTEWSQSMRLTSTAATIVVLGNRLVVASNCDVEINTFSDTLECPTPPSTTGASGGLADSQTTIIGAAVGSSVGAIVAVLIIVVIIVVVIYLRQTRKKKFHANLQARFIEDGGGYSTINRGGGIIPAYVHQNTYDYNTRLQTTSFNPDASVVPSLARSFSDLSSRQVKPNIIKGHGIDGGFYETVNEDTLDIEELYDKVDLATSEQTETKGMDTLKREFAENPLYEKIAPQTSTMTL